MRRMMTGEAVASVIVLALVAALCGAVPTLAAQEITFRAIEKDGAKVWEGGGTIDGTSPVTLKVSNTLNAEHGFSIDSMKIKEVIKPGEEKSITVSPEDIDKSVQEHRVYCQLHPKHVSATIKVSGK